MSSPTRYLNSGALAARYGWSMRTVARRVKSPPPGFPMAVFLNGRWYWAEHEIEAWERSLASNGASNRKAA